ncbi:MAG: hypothetical protein IPH45_08825 [Bacteroidales bacterium]|nr:hypothetical protein [Bacteroidales bacterium]
MKYRLNLKLKLSLQFTLTVVGILLFFSFLVYYFSYSSQRNKFRENLLKRAKNTAILYSNFTEIDTVLLKRIHQSTLSWHNEEIFIADADLNRLYGYNINYLTS